MTALMFYERPVQLDRRKHADLRLRADLGYGFAARVNSVMLVSVEFAEAQRDYPIVFVEVATGQFFSTALLGLRSQENLFVDDQGRWEEGRYVPAFIRRYPFVVTTEMNVCIDEASPTLDRAVGEPLFLQDGGESPALQRATAFLASFQEEVRRTQAFCDSLRDLGLLKPWTVQVAPATGAPYRVEGLHVIDDAKVAALSDETIAAWFRSGDLARLQAHMFSLQNLSALTARLPATSPPETASPSRASPPASGADLAAPSRDVSRRRVRAN